MKRFIIIYILFVAILMQGVPSPAASKRVLCINSYHPSFSWVVEHNAALAEVIGDLAEIAYFHMDTKRIPLSAHHQMTEDAFAFYREFEPDLVVLTDDNALKYLGRKIIASGTPIVYLGINGNPRGYLGTLVLSTGVLERPLLKRAIVHLKEIMGPDMDSCLVLMDDSNTSRAIKQSVFGGRDKHRLGGVGTEIRLLNNYRLWQEAVLTAKDQGYDVLVTGLYHTLKGDGDFVMPDEEVIRWTSANTPIPLFGYWHFSVGKGKAIGGMVLDGRPQGLEAGRLVSRILRSNDFPSIPPVTAAPGRFVFSRSELERWDITLPLNFRDQFGTLEYVE